MRNLTWTQIAGLLPLFLVLGGLIAGSSMGSFDLGVPPIGLGALSLVLIAAASLWLGVSGLFLSAAFISSLALLVPEGMAVGAGAFLALSALAAWLGFVTLIGRRVLIGWQKRKQLVLGKEIEKLRDRVHELETLGVAGGMAEILGAASDAWSKEIQHVVDAGAGLLAAAPAELARGPLGRAFEDAVIATQEGLAAQVTLTAQLRLEAGREATLGDIARRAIELADETLKVRGVEVELDLESSGAPFAVDLDLAAIALRNLIQNAAEASPRGGTIVVRAVSSYRGERGVIEVEDKGSGMSQSVISHIFKPFFTTRTSQLGLGLSVSREIAARMGGSISMSANDLRGMTFRFRVPMRRADLAGTTQERADALAERGSNTRFSSGEYQDSLDLNDQAEAEEDRSADNPSELSKADTARREKDDVEPTSQAADATSDSPDADLAAEVHGAPQGSDGGDLPADQQPSGEDASEPKKLPEEVEEAFFSALTQAKNRRAEANRQEFRQRLKEAESKQRGSSGEEMTE